MAYVIKDLQKIVPVPTTHQIGLKQVLLANDETASAVTQIAKTQLLSGEVVEDHVHLTMDEHYLCFSGEGTLWVDGSEIPFTNDTYVLVKAGSKHHLEAISDISFLTIGIAID